MVSLRFVKSPSDDFTLETLSDVSEFEAVRDEWDALQQSTTDPLPELTSTWLLSWWKAFGEESALSVRLVRKNGSLVLGLPLCISKDNHRGARVRRLHLMANSWVDRSGFLGTSEWATHLSFVTPLLLQQLGRDFDLIDLGPIARDAAFFATFRQEISRHAVLAAWEPSLRSPYMRLHGDWQQVLDSLSPQFRQTVRRKLRKAGKLSGLRFEIRRDAEVMREIEVISLETWQHDQGTSMVSQPNIRELYETVINATARDGSLRVGLMWIDDEPIAFEFNVLSRDTLHNFKLGFRPRYADLSPGLLLKTFVLQAFADELKAGSDLGEYDFKGISEAYKLNWTDEVRDHVRLLVFSKRPDLAALYSLHYRLKPALRQRAPWVFDFKNRLGKLNLETFN
jgi:CelD/BcsL family acetyltransferase involved in cellulose biosynthesis